MIKKILILSLYIGFSSFIIVGYNACENSFVVTENYNTSHEGHSAASENTNSELPDKTDLPTPVEDKDPITPPAGVLFYDDLESGDLSKVQNGFKWGSSNGDPGEHPKTSSDISRSGNHSIKFTYLGGSSNDYAWSEQRVKLGQKMSEVYIQFYVYYPDGTEGLGAKYRHRSNSNNKFFRIWDDEENYGKSYTKAGFSTRGNNIPDSYILPEYGLRNIGTGPFSLEFDTHTIDDSKLGRWLEVKMHFKTDDGSGNGIIEMHFDNKHLINARNVKMYNKVASKNYFLTAYFFGWSNSGFDETTHIYIDDVVISDSPITN